MVSTPFSTCTCTICAHLFDAKSINKNFQHHQSSQHAALLALHFLVGVKTSFYTSAEFRRPNYILWAQHFYVHLYFTCTSDAKFFGSISKRGLDILSVGGPTLYHLQNADITLQASRTTAFRSRTHQGDKQSFTTSSQVNMQCFFALHYSVGEEIL